MVALLRLAMGAWAYRFSRLSPPPRPALSFSTQPAPRLLRNRLPGTCALPKLTHSTLAILFTRALHPGGDGRRSIWGSVPISFQARLLVAPKRWIGLRLRLARGAARCHSDRHSNPPNPGRSFFTHPTHRLRCNRLPGTRPFPRWRWRDAVFEDRFGQSPGSIKFAEPRSDNALRFYPSREQQWPIHLRHQVCGAKQR